MSHEETLKVMNAQINTPVAWHQRWQLEREQNERMSRREELCRIGVTMIRANALKKYNDYSRRLEAAEKEGNTVLIDTYQRMMNGQRGALTAIDDVLGLFEQIATDY